MLQSMELELYSLIRCHTDAVLSNIGSVTFVSQTLSDPENNYSQIEKESLACVFGVKRFYFV